MVELNSSGQSQPVTDPLTADPFFRLPADSNWNACIGKQGTEENYLDGYIEAATELVTTIIEKKMFEKRDTVVLPILYNARHAVELALKFTMDRLVAAGALSSAGPRNHDIGAYLQRLNEADLGDEQLRQHIRTLQPFVASLARIDEDGQELRYHLNRDEDQSLSTYSLANLEVIRDSLADLSKVISGLKYRTIDFIDECATGACTKRVSRRDLICIAKLMPPLGRWKEAIFDEKKHNVMLRFNLSNTQFSKAIEVIKNNREMKALVGGETSLQYLPDDTIAWVIAQWRKVHMRRSDGEAPTIVTIDKMTFQAMIESSRVHKEVVSALQIYLTDEQLAELEAIYYLGRDGWFPERFEDYVESLRKRHEVERDPQKQISHLMHKTNFLLAVRRALPRLGRPSLAARLAEI
jgi:hypothetical protein